MNDNEKIRYNNFIEKLYNSPSATSQDKERIVKLLLSEREKGFVTEEKVRELIQSEMKKKGIEDSKQNGEKEFSHNPLNMVNFLYQFSVNDKFKWFTHAPDPTNPDPFNYLQYINIAKENYGKISYGVNTSTWSNVMNFIFDTDKPAMDAYGKKIDVCWKDMSEWCMANRNQHPYDVLIGDYRFERYIDIFKNAIQFRTDNDEYLFNKRVRKFLSEEAINDSDIKLSFSNDFRSIGSTVRTFIDVRQLFAFMKIIGKWIIENKSKGNRVEIAMVENDNSYTLTLLHVGSSLNLDNEKLNGLSGDFHKTRNILLNVADWTILADTENLGPIFITCLDNGTKNKKSEVITKNQIKKATNTVGGVKHLITFYKNKQ